MMEEFENLEQEFRSLSLYDRKRILKKLPHEKRELFLDLLDDSADTAAEIDETRAAEISSSSNYAPWIEACLNPERRRDFPALRSSFLMTERAQRSLREALLISAEISGEGETAPSFVAANDTDLIPHQGPSLMSKMGGFLSRKMMSL